MCCGVSMSTWLCQRSSWTPEQSRDDMFYSLAPAEPSRNVEPKQPSSRACASPTEEASRVTIVSVQSLRASQVSVDNAMRSPSFSCGQAGCGRPSPLIMA